MTSTNLGARSLRTSAILVGASLIPSLLLGGCGGGSGTSSKAGSMDLLQVSNGFGQLLPHKVYRLNA
ncbi:MAG: hypothetical protein NTY35_10655, partial [Planctomycetota bacterium]|nr:hypothetical protein [Planctomycetota bacterium]